MKKQEQEELLRTLEARFTKNMHRHREIAWSDVRAKLEGSPEAMRSLREMDSTGGEPDVVAHDQKPGMYTFFDCCPESPVGRRSVCYDRGALESRKEHKPESSAVEMAAEMGIAMEPSSVIAVTAGCSCTTTARSRTTPPEVFEGHVEFEHCTMQNE